ncbi:MAG: hypothetical protein Dbin4_00416 [Alphaproteobacteria bacterium]|nr:hypothetical protein [Alphaproteobacteria bacterium]
MVRLSNEIYERHCSPNGKDVRSTVLTPEEEAAAVAFRKYTLLPLDDCLYALQSSIPHLTRSSLHRCFQRHDISRLPDIEGSKPARKKFKRYPIGYFHIDIAEVQTQEGKLYLFVAIDRTSKFAFVELHERATRANATEFLRRVIEAVPYKIHTVLTDNGIQFTNQQRQKYAFRHTLSYRRLPFGYSAGMNLGKPQSKYTTAPIPSHSPKSGAG